MPVVSGALALMELKGLVKEIGAMSYISLMETPPRTRGRAETRSG